MTVGQGSLAAFDGDRWYAPIVVALERAEGSRSWRRTELGEAVALADAVIGSYEPSVVRLREPERLADVVGTAGCETVERSLRRAARRVGAELTVDGGSAPPEEA